MASQHRAAYRIVHHAAHLFGAVSERIPWLTVDHPIVSVPLPSRAVLVWRLTPKWEQPELPGVR